MKLLNPGYTAERLGGSLYYNSKSGNCYCFPNNMNTSCDFTSTGIKNEETKSKIAEVNWNTGGFDKTEVYFNVLYSNERDNKRKIRNEYKQDQSKYTTREGEKEKVREVIEKFKKVLNKIPRKIKVAGTAVLLATAVSITYAANKASCT